MIIPIKTDAPLYYWPYATFGIIAVNVLLFFVTEIPFDVDALSLSIAVHTFAVPTKLRVVRRQQEKSRSDAISESVHERSLTGDRLNVPMWRYWALIDDLRVPLSRKLFFHRVRHDNPLETG